MSTETVLGMRTHLPAEDYHADPSWGSTSLKAMRKGPPARVRWEQANPRHTDALAFGTAVHCCVLTPDLYVSAYAHKPDGMSFATKDGKAWRETQAGKTILTHDQTEAIKAVALALDEKGLVAQALSSDRREMSLFWEDEATGEPCKGRVDLLDDRYIYDLKISRYASGDLAYRAFFEGWLHQLAHYRTGAHALGLGWLGARIIVVSPTAPHFVYTVEIKPDALDLLAIENSQTIYALRQHRLADDWPGTPDEWKLIEPPPSALIANTVFDNIPEESDDAA